MREDLAPNRRSFGGPSSPAGPPFLALLRIPWGMFHHDRAARRGARPTRQQLVSLVEQRFLGPRFPPVTVRGEDTRPPPKSLRAYGEVVSLNFRRARCDRPRIGIPCRRAMAKPSRPWIVTKHGPIVKLEDNLWVVEGEVPG